jgi:hypothetical protein
MNRLFYIITVANTSEVAVSLAKKALSHVKIIGPVR